MSLLDDYITLFRGRGDCYGAWDGGCIREPLTKEVFEGHLFGDKPIGVYPHFNVTREVWGSDGPVREPRTECVWGCTDIDKTDDPTAALAIHEAFAAVNVTSWVERSAHGYHVWVFANQLVPAVDMRRMFLAAHQVAGVPAKEVNPKQEHLKAGEVGNYVRLPYPCTAIAKSTPPGCLPYAERYMIRNGGWMTTPHFVDLAIGARTSPSTIATLATYYTPPAPPRQITQAPTQDMAEAARRLTPLGRTIFRDGPLPERDRSTTLLRLVHEAHEAGLAPEDCRVLLEDADLRWGKFMARGAKGEQELLKMIDKVYGVG